jgi:hypothetical protein
MTLLIPRYQDPTQIQFDRIASALFTGDQFDDWLPDVVYYQDQLNDMSQVLTRLKSLWQRASIPSPSVETLQLPRASGTSVSALTLPLDLRLCAHAVISSFAPRIASKIPRDKVYGFRFLRDGARVFDPPGDELSRALDTVGRAARADAIGTFEILDVIAFSTSAQPERLVATLQRCGARPDECNFLRALASLGGGGLPSIDDAFAFAYNFYLQPVDTKLLQGQHNFFRYRDEYFVFDAQTKQTVESELSALNLKARTVARSLNIDDVIDQAKDELSRQEYSVDEPLVKLPLGTFFARVTCTSWEDQNCSDFSEQLFFERPDINDLFQTRIDKPLDAVQVLPQLRDFNSKRCSGVVLAPPFTGETPLLSGYRSSLRRGREWLGKVLATGVHTNSSWQAGWAATLLSDLGFLTDAETGLLLRLIASSGIHETAKVQARIALARSSNLGADRFWTSAAPTTEYRRRGMLLAARHLARRNVAPWNTLLKKVGGGEPQLVQHLTANMRVQ